MYTKIALVLLGMTLSVGGALALVLAQSSSVKRPMPPQMSYSSPETSVKPRMASVPARPAVPKDAVSREKVVAAPAPRPVLGKAKAPSGATIEVAIVPKEPASTAKASNRIARAPAPTTSFGASVSQPNISPYSALANGLNAKPLPATRSLGLTETPMLRPEAVANNWAIGVYR